MECDFLVKVLVLNCGSSSLKYQLLDMAQSINDVVIAKGLVEKIGLTDAEFSYTNNQGVAFDAIMEIESHQEAIKVVLDSLVDPEKGVITNMSEIVAVGHRIVHGGSVFTKATVLGEKEIAELEKLSTLAPLHNPPALLGIKACQENMPEVPMVGVFDTSFHQTMPEVSYIYPVTYELYEKHGIRRYGFHGTSHKYVSRVAASLLGKPVEETKIITCHLGNGSSIAAVEGGQCVATSMGYTPLAGVAMGTRSGDIDPAIATHLVTDQGMTAAEVDNYLNKKSGLLGISGVSSDMRAVEKAAAEGNHRAQLAIDLVVRRIQDFIGAYMVAMGGVDAIVFTAGMGENSITIRERICKNLEFVGLELDAEANNVRGQLTEITKPTSKIKAFLIPTNEELMIAHDTAKVLHLLDK